MGSPVSFLVVIQARWVKCSFPQPIYVEFSGFSVVKNGKIFCRPIKSVVIWKLFTTAKTANPAFICREGAEFDDLMKKLDPTLLLFTAMRYNRPYTWCQGLKSSWGVSHVDHRLFAELFHPLE
jgi:hypothetical protein